MSEINSRLYYEKMYRRMELWRDIKIVAGIWGLLGVGVLIGWLLFS